MRRWRGTRPSPRRWSGRGDIVVHHVHGKLALGVWPRVEGGLASFRVRAATGPGTWAAMLESTAEDWVIEFTAAIREPFLRERRMPTRECGRADVKADWR